MIITHDFWSGSICTLDTCQK